MCAMSSPRDADSQDPAPEGERRVGLLERLALHRPELRAWALYDWANSAFVCVVITAVYPIYFSTIACAEPGLAEEARRALATERHALVTTISMLLIALASPLLGAIADYSATKKRMLGLFLSGGLASTAGLFLVREGDWPLAMVLFGLANVGAAGSFVFYDALLPSVAREDEMDRLSTSGYALGYLGGGLLLGVCLLVILRPEMLGLPAGTLPTRLAFLSVALWWLGFSIPLFRRVREPRFREPGEGPRENRVRAALARLRATLGELRRYRQAFLLMLAFLVYNDGVGTIYRMAVPFGKEIGLDDGAMILAILIVQFIGVPCAFLFGALAGRIGAKASILLGLLVYTGICVFAYRMTTEAEFYVLAGLVGLVQGGVQALSRSLFASMVPSHKSGEFFGLFAVLEKFAGIAGPAIFGLIHALTGSSRQAILAMIGFFVIGAALLLCVNVTAGRRVARAAEERVVT